MNSRTLRRLRVEGAILYIIALICFFAVPLPYIVRGFGFVLSFVGLFTFLQSGFQIDDLLSEEKETVTRRAQTIRAERKDAMEV